ncbi:longitudinals lacking protein, isoforms A/B/D/L-like [Diaphorina citri]|uniref:Longitudinals lacking protein, isoforms A/B/D/L-like n=1 Tax=Diaphorina citri TaxID=121845 RepID=A0A3Q0J8V4_DIACI|nr:longitudinals lacking protein, isoforms A/B/D/L-like [Diaphorina citri]
MYACDVCGKVYQHKQTLDRHKKDECGQEPKFECPHCPYRSKRKDTLDRHMKIIHFSD